MIKMTTYFKYIYRKQLFYYRKCHLIQRNIDSFIEKTTGMKVSEIFLKYSEDYFRKLEYDTIKMICTGKNKIISTGGGAFENPDNRATLLKFGKVFYLKSDLDILYYRIYSQKHKCFLHHIVFFIHKKHKQLLPNARMYKNTKGPMVTHKSF